MDRFAAQHPELETARPRRRRASILVFLLAIGGGVYWLAGKQTSLIAWRDQKDQAFQMESSTIGPREYAPAAKIKQATKPTSIESKSTTAGEPTAAKSTATESVSASPTPSNGVANGPIHYQVSFAEVRRSRNSEVKSGLIIKNLAEQMKNWEGRANIFPTFPSPAMTSPQDATFEVPLLIEDPQNPEQELGILIRVQYHGVENKMVDTGVYIHSEFQAGAQMKSFHLERRYKIPIGGAIAVIGSLPHKEYSTEEKNLFSFTFLPEVMSSSSFANQTSDFIVLISPQP